MDSTVTFKQEKISGRVPQPDRLIDHQSQCDFDFEHNMTTQKKEK
jgi:hypothetical protein